jgi:fructose-bisphosphate aldolase class II
MTAIGTLRNTSKDTLRDALTRLEKEGAALGHFNVADQVLLKAVIAAAAETKLPVLVGASEGEREFFGARPAGRSGEKACARNLICQSFSMQTIHIPWGRQWRRRMRPLTRWELIFPHCPSMRMWLAQKEAVQAIKAVNPAILVEGEIGDIGSGLRN